jgi:hypothetical protein
MSRKSSAFLTQVPAEKLVRDIRRATCKRQSAEDGIRFVLEGLRGEASIAVRRLRFLRKMGWPGWWRKGQGGCGRRAGPKPYPQPVIPTQSSPAAST